jgi:hypothetical protein
MPVSAILDEQGSILSWINSCDCIRLEQQLAKSAFQFLAASWVLDSRQRPDRSAQKLSKCARVEYLAIDLARKQIGIAEWELQ